MNTPYDILLQSSIVFVRMGSVVGLLVGIAMMAGPKRMEQVDRLLSRPVGTGRIRQALNRPHWIERYFYAHHHIAGAALLIGAVIGLYAFIFSPSAHAFAYLFPRSLRWLWDAAVMIMAAGSILAVLVGLAMTIRPDFLRKIEEPANHSISTERFFMLFSMNRLFSTPLLLRYRKIVGPLLVIACIYNLVLLQQMP